MNKHIILLYGDSGRGKTSSLDQIMNWLRARNPNAKARLYTAEHTGSLQNAIQAGSIETWRLDNRPAPFEALRLAVRGYWPKDVNDPTSKLEASHLGDYSAFFFEGLSTFGDYLMGGKVHGSLASRAARNDRIGPAEEAVMFKDGTTAIGGNCRTHYNIVQGEILDLIDTSYLALPGLVVWTAHETRALDEYKRNPIVGPQVVGTAKTADVPRHFSTVLHLTTAKAANGALQYRLFLRDHFEPDLPNAPFKAKNGITLQDQPQVPDYLEGGALAIPTFLSMLFEAKFPTKSSTTGGKLVNAQKDTTV